MITLVDSYHQSSWDLHYSLLRSGYHHPTIAINDDGFLPDDVTSPYLYYTGFNQASGSACYFNQVQVPTFWEIRGDGNQAEVYEDSRKRAHIHYAEPRHNRLVKAVDWYDEAGRTRLTDRYNKFGYRYAQTIYNLEGQLILTSYFDREGQEVLIENHQTGDLILNEAGQVLVFKHRTDFILHYLRAAGFELDRIFYNSLSVPFLTAFYMGGEGQDVLFWQEPIGDAIPGNMQLLLDDQGRKTQIMVQDRETYERLKQLLLPHQLDKVAYLGYLYPFAHHDLDHQQALILTNSDQLEGIDELISQNPEVHFHIGALTEMSPKLTRLASHKQVSLYPNITLVRARQLLSTCGIYLDINHQSEILSAVRSAFENRLVILAFEDTAHNRQYTADSLVFSSGRIAELSTYLQTISQDSAQFQLALAQQETKANLTTIADYQAQLG